MSSIGSRPATLQNEAKMRPSGAFIKRIGKAECKKMVEDMMTVPTHDVAPEFYVDWGDAREYGVGDLGEGECAGEVVTPAEFQLTAAEREAFEAQLQLERGEVEAAAATAYGAMSHGALALLKHRGVGFPEDAESVLQRFKKHLYDTNLFHDDFVGGKFAQYYFEAHENRGERLQRRAGPPPGRGDASLPGGLLRVLCQATAAACSGGGLGESWRTFNT